jgi:DNA repair exonuclease SbcCD ATPase subunit
MRIQRVVARAFGPFQDRSLDLAPGMTVIAGPNESGKSSWHAALRLAITGVRRGKGPGTAAERQLAERHRPWDRPERWEVEARLQLDDGRLIDISQDLGAKVACRAVDVALGRDVSDEIMDGTPDASRWLGLDRDSFAATVSVSQAQILAVADEASALQEQMQRAAATRGTDATAAEAIARLEQFRKDAVGADTIAAKGPLRTAKNRLAASDAALAQARAQHAEYLERAAAVDEGERAAEASRRRLAGAEAAHARMQAADFAARAARAAELSGRHPAPPLSLAADDELSGRVTGLLQAWADRPQPVALQGRTADEIQLEIDTLPAAPIGDVEPHSSVTESQARLLAAKQALAFLGDPPPEGRPAAAGWSPEQLRDLARRLDLRDLPEVAALQAQLAQFQMSRAPRSGARVVVPVAAGIIGAVAGVWLFAAGLPLLGGLLAGSALLVAIALFVTMPANVKHSPHAPDALAPYRDAVARTKRERDAALRAAQEAGLPADAGALSRLADEAALAEQLAEARAAWSERRASLMNEIEGAGRALAVALAERAVEVGVGDDPSTVAAAYVADCAIRGRQQRDADGAESLSVELAARRSAEESARRASERERTLLDGLRVVAREAGLNEHAEPAAICAALDAWRTERAASLDAAQRALAEWQQLQGLLEGRSLDELQTEAARRRERAIELAAGLPPDAITLPVGIDPDDFLAELRHNTQALVREHDLARGSLRARRDALPDVAEAEETWASARSELDRIEKLAQTIQATLGLLRDAQERVHRDLAPILAQAVGRWLPVVSGGRYAEASVDPASLAIRVKESATGQWREARLLSEGTREQIYLLLRVAMAEHLVVTGERAPLLLDEVTAQADGARKRELLAVLHRLSEERQVIVFTHDDDVAAWADAELRAPDDAVIRLQGAAAIPVQVADGRQLPEPMIPVAVD